MPRRLRQGVRRNPEARGRAPCGRQAVRTREAEGVCRNTGQAGRDYHLPVEGADAQRERRMQPGADPGGASLMWPATATRRRILTLMAGLVMSVWAASLASAQETITTEAIVTGLSGLEAASDLETAT